MKQRTRIATTIAGLSLLAPALQVAAQPAAKPLRFLVGAPAGGSNDIFARAIGQRMSESIGQPVVVDNRPGASQMIAADLTAKALADGNTLYMTSTTYTTGAALMAKLPFDPLNDLTGITMVARGPMVLVVHPSVPAKNVKELIAIARARPGQLNYTSSGIGGINHFGVEVLKSMAKIDMVHVPHKGMAPAITDLMAGQVQVLLVSLTAVETQMQSGRLRAIGVSSPQRSAFLPNLPAIAETLPGYDNDLWWGVFTASKVPKARIDQLNVEIQKTMASEELKKRFAEFGAVAAPTTPDGFNTIVKNEIAKWGKVIREANIKAE
jgi:tripartite-type tricarboxylate transporter receptor subunit TctC